MAAHGLAEEFPMALDEGGSPPIRRHARTGSVSPVSHPLLKLSFSRPAAEHLPTSQMKWQHPGQMLEIFSCFFSKPHLLHLCLWTDSNTLIQKTYSSSSPHTPGAFVIPGCYFVIL